MFQHVARAESKNRLGVTKGLKIFTDIFSAGYWYLH